MELKPLESFLAVISTGSITGAARVLGRSQPVVTRHIQELEAEIGFELFRRNGPRISPTEQGLRFHVEVERLLKGMQQLAERAGAIARSAPLAIEIAAIPALAAGLLPVAIARLDPALLPNSVHLRSSPAEQIVQSVLARNADIGVSSLPLDHPGLELHRLYQAPCVVALAQTHPLAGKSVISAADFAGQINIGMANPFRLRRRIDLALATAGVVPGPVIDTNSTVNALQLVRHSGSMAIVEPVTALGAPMAGIVTRPLDVDIPFVWGVVTALNAPLSPTARTLIDLLDSAARSLLPNVEMIDAADADRLDRAVYGVSVSLETDQPAS
jgi:DNA-binding transcriptional LysR family regulator